MASEMIGQPSRRFHQMIPVRRNLAWRKCSMKNLSASAWRNLRGQDVLVHVVRDRAEEHRYLLCHQGDAIIVGL